jgi:hypothetical protein
LNNNWKQVAWNGIRFNTPSTWEVGQISARHLILENDSQPAMEVKWGPIKGKFSHPTHLKRLSALHRKVLQKTVTEWQLPFDWEKALSDYQVSGFSWQGRKTIGQGVILYCSSCRNATLIQFFQPKSAKTDKIPLEVLKTFNDHRDDDQVVWCVFDIRAIIPKNYKLVHHRFAAGKYELGFADGAQKINLYRWAPASVLLNERNLSQFAKTIPDFSSGNPIPGIIEGYQAVKWCQIPRFKWLRWTSRLMPKPSYQWWRLWHVKEKNLILGVKMQAKRLLNTYLLNTICTNYESL